jgi:hypothetical protein
MSAEATALLPIVNQVIDFIESSLAEITGQEAKAAALSAEIDKRKKQEKILLEKVAAASTPVFSEEAIEQTLNRLQDARIIKPMEHIKLAAEMRNKPASVLDLLARISVSFDSSASAGGEGYAKESSVSEADPDGWNDFAAGKRVKQKQ